MLGHFEWWTRMKNDSKIFSKPATGRLAPVLIERAGNAKCTSVIGLGASEKRMTIYLIVTWLLGLECCGIYFRNTQKTKNSTIREKTREFGKTACFSSVDWKTTLTTRWVFTVLVSTAVYQSRNCFPIMLYHATDFVINIILSKVWLIRWWIVTCKRPPRLSVDHWPLSNIIVSGGLSALEILKQKNVWTLVFIIILPINVVTRKKQHYFINI
jgi:hypothetical protein